MGGETGDGLAYVRTEGCAFPVSVERLTLLEPAP